MSGEAGSEEQILKLKSEEQKGVNQMEGIVGNLRGLKKSLPG